MDGSRLRERGLEGHLSLEPKPEGLETTASKRGRDLCPVSPETLSNHTRILPLGDRENRNKAGEGAEGASCPALSLAFAGMRFSDI